MSDLPFDRLRRLRELRRTVRELRGTMIADLKPFLNIANRSTFRRLPYSDLGRTQKDVGVTVTCTVLMALASADRLAELYTGEQTAEGALDQIMAAPWKSSGLPEGNYFTKILVLRAAGILLGKTGADGIRTKRRPKGQTLRKIADQILDKRGAPETIQVGKYAANPALVYWFVDAFELLFGELAPDRWTVFARWAARELSRQVSLVTSSHDTMMDPVSMAMAACLSARLRAMTPHVDTADQAKELPNLPSTVELRNALRLLMGKQADSGIWGKYFPMFHYLKADAGGNYCFSFEMLEAILSEFAARDDEDEDLLSDNVMLAGFERAVAWVRHNRLSYKFGEDVYRGWNSGGQIETLVRGVPESWATAVVHMFLHKLDEALCFSVARMVRAKYNARKLGAVKAGALDWDTIIDVAVIFETGGPESGIKAVLEDQMIRPILGRSREADEKIPHRRSALLFGPPGTSKSTLVREFARRIAWPYIEITPSDFLSDGLEKIYVRANQIFEDLMDLSGSVILFDEMDALVQRRTGSGDEPLDVIRQFLTTSMLPKLAELHSQGRVVFFFATNHQKDFDEAIKRPGRFDLLLCMGPPKWRDKIKGVSQFLPPNFRQEENIALKLRDWVERVNAQDQKRESDKPVAGRNRTIEEQLDYFTLGDTRAFFEYLSKKTPTRALSEQLDDERELVDAIARWYNDLIVLRPKDGEGDNQVRKEYDAEKRRSRYQ